MVELAEVSLQMMFLHALKEKARALRPGIHQPLYPPAVQDGKRSLARYHCFPLQTSDCQVYAAP